MNKEKPNEDYVAIPTAPAGDNIINTQAGNEEKAPPKGKEQIKEKQLKADKPVAFYKLFRYADSKDIFLMTIGFISAMVNGTCLPLFSLVFGSMSDDFNKGPDALLDAVARLALYLFLIGIGTFVLSAVSQSFWMISGERQSIRYRYNYFEAVLYQNVGWYDTINPNELAAKIANETFKVQGAIGEKVPTFVMTMFIFIAGFGIGFAKGWQLSLVIAASLPIITFAAFFFIYVIQNITSKTAESYSSAGAQAEQALSSIKTVKALVGEKYEAKIYLKALKHAKSITIKYGILTGVGLGFIYFCMFADYGLGFWFGSKLIEDHIYNSTQNRDYTVGDVLSVFFCIIFSAFSLGQAAPCFKNFALGQQAAAQIFKIIDRVPDVIIDDKTKAPIGDIQTDIVINNVKFKYPTRDVYVANDVSIKLLKNKKNALVGESGSGKSTMLQLIERFYDPESGSVEINGKNIKEYNLKSLRKKIGYVGQEPVLFATTIRENMRYGKEDATETEMIDALKASNAWNFIEKLEKKLDTFVGVAGGQFSGGQKQRIAIARAILKNPPILLLDEATSALDRVSEKLIQKTLDEISLGRTTVTIAHRLSTVQNSDRIFVFDQGKVVEIGTHEELLAMKGKYYELVNSQITHAHNDAAQIKAEKSQDENINDLLNKEDDVVVANMAPLSIQKKESSRHSKHETEEEKQKRLLEEKKVKAEEAKRKKQINSRLMKYSSPEKLILILGIFAAILNGVVMPFFGLVLGKMMKVLAMPFLDDFREKANLYSLLFLILAILSFIFNALQTYLMSIVSENLTLRVRKDLFNKILRMPQKWFDFEKNSPGTLSARLAVDANLINGLTSTSIGIAMMSLGAFIGGLVISFYYAWHLTLVSLAVSPLLMYAGKVQAEFAQGFAASTDEAYKESGGLIMESVTNIRTVASFSNEKIILKIFEDKLEFPKKQAIKRGATAGIIFGFSQFTMFAVYAIIFYVGAHFMTKGWMGYEDMYISIFSIMFASFSSGNASQFMPDAGAGYNAARAIFEILDDSTEIEIHEKYFKENKHEPIKQKDVVGNIEFRNVSFKYPSREKLVLDNLSFTANEGQKIALVGSSGCGKSTCLQLLMRFYEVDAGEILLDGVNIKDYDVSYLRGVFGVVSQEPVLFNGSVAYNIKYNNKKAEIKDIEEAAEKANALNFIKNNQFDSGKDDSKQYGSGFDRKVGPKGSQISGGQKQRIAIARAILKQPRILLLDEATSALDMQSEIVVQDSLNNLMKGKTSLTVAHRIPTIKDSDCILVFDQGKIVERGTYRDLIAKRGFFYNFELGIEHDPSKL